MTDTKDKDATIARLRDVMEAVKQACLFVDDDGTIRVTQAPHIHSELFDKICAALTTPDIGTTETREK